MTAFNRTSPAPPSSAPRDLTIVRPTNGDPHSLTLNWQPPKYSNGEIEGCFFRKQVYSYGYFIRIV